jgi:hypothetical protein
MEVPSGILRRMGFKSDNRGIINRFIQESNAWEEHLQHSRNFILKAIAGKTINNLAVYGSGWCLDLPLDELAGMAGSIQLYDLVHPPQVLHRLRKFRNVSAIQEDITGGAIIMSYQSVREYKKYGRKVSPEQIGSLVFQPAICPDYSISLNIYSQIGEVITEYLKAHVPYTPEEINRIACLLQQSHLQLLAPGRACLITDVREFDYDLQDQKSEIGETIIYPLPLSEHKETWEWQFDLHGGYRTDKKTVLQVLALEI